MGNRNQVSHRICSFLDPKQLENYRFGGIFLKVHIFTQITFKTIDLAAFFFVGRTDTGHRTDGHWRHPFVAPLNRRLLCSLASKKAPILAPNLCDVKHCESSPIWIIFVETKTKAAGDERRQPTDGCRNPTGSRASIVISSLLEVCSVFFN